MTRGTTPEITFQLPFDAGALTKLSIAFEQNGVLVLEKTLEDCTVSGQTVTVPLTEADTLAFRQNGSVLQIQLRCGIGEKRLASEIMTATVGRILKEGAL